MLDARAARVPAGPVCTNRSGCGTAGSGADAAAAPVTRRPIATPVGAPDEIVIMCGAPDTYGLKAFRSGSIKRSTVVRAPRTRVWRSLSDITGLPKWATGVKGCRFKTRTRRGVGAVRSLVFEDGNRIEEHVVGWRGGESFTYVAVSGLPLRAYVATISLEERGGGTTTRITWQSYLNSEKMTGAQFAGFLASMGEFYEKSLENLRGLLEGRGATAAGSGGRGSSRPKGKYRSRKSGT